MLSDITTRLAELRAGRASLAVIGLGYVGFPLAVHFGQHFKTIGYDSNRKRVDQLNDGVDLTHEVESDRIDMADKLVLTSDPEMLSNCQVYVVAVPTPIDQAKRPDLGPLLAASRLIAGHLKAGDVVIFESTVYPGATEEDCVPVLEQGSGLVYQRGSDPAPDEADHLFYCGYSPERINPGDRAHRLADIVKVTSGSTPMVADFVDQLYLSIISAGTFRAESIRIAEAAKVIENIQRDLNIALVNELAILFNRLGIDTASVLAAAGSKWNFLPFSPGLVGGHCIGVDPYYLTYKAQSIGFHPEVILAGRRVNDGMGIFVAGELIKLMARAGVYRPGARVLVLGLSFKENCPDLRNTRVIDVIRELESFNLSVDVHDPWVSAEEVRETHDLNMLDTAPEGAYDGVIMAVAHHQFLNRENDLKQHLVPGGVLYDVRSILPRELVDGRL
ncbi:nucleotide sugar dehydrogenase [Wenzhouxiangella sp. EGI_FJ10305]|uniref:nucleotide sugar dehydrogenase n=1 Tax=Wenzhouxiangella sp. EGI_FJ10305 TaxID=3243768 RepID=UPI0035DF2A2D